MPLPISEMRIGPIVQHPAWMCSWHAAQLSSAHTAQGSERVQVGQSARPHLSRTRPTRFSRLLTFAVLAGLRWGP